jgi:hypothetical protein
MREFSEYLYTVEKLGINYVRRKES